MKDLDFASGIFLLLFGSFLAVEALKLPLGGFRHPDAGFLPFGVSLVMIFLSVLVLAGALRKGHLKEWLRFGEGKWKVWIAVLGMLAYVLVLNSLGFLLSTFLIMLLLLRVLERQGWTTSLAISLPSVLLGYLLFTRGLGVPLPRGIIPV
jgi:putative tricarboxylic transport membrane protein